MVALPPSLPFFFLLLFYRNSWIKEEETHRRYPKSTKHCERWRMNTIAVKPTTNNTINGISKTRRRQRSKTLWREKGRRRARGDEDDRGKERRRVWWRRLRACPKEEEYQMRLKTHGPPFRPILPLSLIVSAFLFSLYICFYLFVLFFLFIMLI